MARDSAAQRLAAASARRRLRLRDLHPFRLPAIALEQRDLARAVLVLPAAAMASPDADSDALAADLAGADSDSAGDLVGDSDGRGILGIGIPGGDGALRRIGIRRGRVITIRR